MAMISDPVLIAHILQCMLIAFWYLCTFAAAVTALDLPFPRVFKEAVRLSASRGKTWDGKPSALGWLKVLLPSRLALHDSGEVFRHVIVNRLLYTGRVCAAHLVLALLPGRSGM